MFAVCKDYFPSKTSIGRELKLCHQFFLCYDRTILQKLNVASFNVDGNTEIIKTTDYFHRKSPWLVYTSQATPVKLQNHANVILDTHSQTKNIF